MKLPEGASLPRVMHLHQWMYYIGTLMRFTYGADGRPMSINYSGTDYYYVLNLQGDVVARADGTFVDIAAPSNLL